MGAPSTSLLQRLQDAQKQGGLGAIVGHEEAAAWGNRDLSSASYEDLVGAFGASDLMDPASPSAASSGGSATPSMDRPPSAGTPGTLPPSSGTTSPGGPGGMGAPSALSMMSGPLQPPGNPPAGWMDTGGGMGGGPLGTRQYPQQGTALSRMTRRTGRVY